MRYLGEGYSPSDLVTFLGCLHASFLDVRGVEKQIKVSKASQLFLQKGLEHERAYLEQLKDKYKVIEIPTDIPLKERSFLTAESMRSGADVIYQAVLQNDSWRGDADFLIKHSGHSDLGNFIYEVYDTKLTHTPEPKHIIQLCVYSELLQVAQGAQPKRMHVFSGAGQLHTFKTSDFFYYYRRAKKKFENHMANLPADSYPSPCGHCKICKWSESCKSQWKNDNHISLVANIQSSHISKLHKAGIESLLDLAKTDEGTKVPDLNGEVFLRLRAQAVLQAHKIKTGENKMEILDCPAGKGFERMPLPDSGDLFFDMEGDPLYPDGLEYLFGIYYFEGQGGSFKTFWAHTHKEEKVAFKGFMSFIEKHLRSYPGAHIYHYNHYETTALKRLACRHAVCEEQLDNLLRHKKFVDLYLVVRESIRISEPSYSIKNLETFYMDKRENSIVTATDSIVVYNEWRQTGNHKLLQDIANYNKIDCVSTQLLRDWLASIKPKNIAWFKEGIAIEIYERKDWEIEYERYQERLEVLDELGESLSHLLEFHNREAKPGWWNIFDRQNKFEDELIDDAECLGGLVKVDVSEPEKRSLIYTYKFPPQEYKLKAGHAVIDIAKMENAGTVVEINESGIIKIRRSIKKDALPKRLSIGPSGPIDSKIIRSAVYRLANELIANGPIDTSALETAPTPDPALGLAPEPAPDPDPATELLSRAVPRIIGKEPGSPIISDDLQKDALEAVYNLDHSYLFIQGPPGAGKTYTSSCIIVELIKRGKRIGITSNSHKAIHNLLQRIEEIANERGIEFQGIKKASSGNEETFFNGTFVKNETKTQSISLEAQLFAGTAWLFAHEHLSKQLDYLFIDEAGQVALANVIAMSTCAKNIILVGDQMQLGQAIRGVHPGKAGLSILEFLLDGNATVSPERGLFLPETRRLRPSICKFISEAFYNGRLLSHEITSKRTLNLKGLPNEGIVMISVDHSGCGQKSVEEGLVIKEKYNKLIGQTIDQDGKSRTITENDILVMTPYNVQVNYLRSLLPQKARVGTVDKFQGQEAAIAMISMVTSSAEDLPRNIEFLYSKNRLNVAISRAQCLVVIVANPKLLETSCETVEQMKLVNTFCWLDEYAHHVND